IDLILIDTVSVRLDARWTASIVVN
ncbi:MAG: hypothetical protein QOE48_1611, partial [Mycobacterium sp.]|nr:hypothetical protein [Mycobacterium sp.]